VLTRNEEWAEDGAEVANSVDEAMRLANAPHVSVIGGAEIYHLFLPHADRIELTEVHVDVDGDTRLDPLGPEWAEVARISHAAEGERPAFDFVTLKRRG
jgi:dihydrofolate reductase